MKTHCSAYILGEKQYVANMFSPSLVQSFTGGGLSVIWHSLLTIMDWTCPQSHSSQVIPWMDLSLCVLSSGFTRQLLTGGQKEILANVSKSGHSYLTILSLNIISIDSFSPSFVLGTISLAFCYHKIINKKNRININTAFQFLIFWVIYTHLQLDLDAFLFKMFYYHLNKKKRGKKSNPMIPEISVKFSRGGTKHLQRKSDLCCRSFLPSLEITTAAYSMDLHKIDPKWWDSDPAVIQAVL